MNKKSSCQCPSSHENCPKCLFEALPSYSFDGLSDLLSSNDPPENVDSAISLRLACIEASTTLPDLISATRTMLKRMEEKQAVVNAAVRDISTVLHPIRSLPDDILSTIFHWCTPYAHPPSLYVAVDSLSPDLPPWTISHVCRRWRALVISLPTLWSTLSIPLDAYTYPPGHRPRAALRLELFLQRSRNVELDVALQEYEPSDESDEDETDDEFTDLPGLRQRRDFLQLLYPTIPRWRGLDVHINECDITYLFRCSMAHLRRLSFSMEVDFSHTDVLFGNELIGITSLTWGLVTITTSTWENVKVFTSPWSSLHHLPKMLNLEVLYVNDMFDDEDYYVLQTTFSLPKLHTLSLSPSIGITTMIELFRYLVAPTLLTLVLKVTTNDWGDNYACNDIFPRLSNLFFEVNCFEVFPIIPIDILTQTTSFTALYLSPNNARPELLEVIGTKLLPKLTSLRLHFSTMRRYAKHVISMIESRLSSRDVASLEEVRLVRSGKDEWYTVETMEMKDRAGLLRRWATSRENVNVRYHQ